MIGRTIGRTIGLAGAPCSLLRNARSGAGAAAGERRW
jgi:hypothetical protein